MGNNNLLDFGPVEDKMQGIIKVIGVGVVTGMSLVTLMLFFSDPEPIISKIANNL